MMRRPAATWIGVTLLFAALTAVMAWPMVRHATSLAPMHQDVYFNMWRLRWFAHALATSPAHLFDANIFFPEKDTLAYSDAMPVEGLIAAPFAALNPVVVHNMMMLAPIALSAVAIFALCRHLTGSRGAGLVAGTAFAFAPYRFEHIMHMELQWTVWMPLAFLALHRLYDSGRWRDGLAVGACLALQMLSSIYYGIFLATLLGVAAAFLFAADRRVPWRRALLPLIAGLAIAGAVSVAYSRPYSRVHARVGDRPTEEVHIYSARPPNYLVTPEGNWLYGNPGRPGRGERRLFPGAIVTLLAIAGLMLRRPAPRLIVYLVLVALAFDMSLGFNGVTYPVLAHVIGPFRSLRALARLGIFVVMFLSVLAAYGYTFTVQSSQPLVRAVACACLMAGMLIEYVTTFPVATFPSAPPPIYRFLAHLPRGIVAEVPMSVPGETSEGRSQYLSTFHWFPIVNGYSGNFPPTYLARIERMEEFPGERALRQLRYDRVTYLVVHESAYSAPRAAYVYDTLERVGAAQLGQFEDGEGKARLYRLR
jgi:hypothetical protein